jgi:hypothetical protein
MNLLQEKGCTTRTHGGGVIRKDIGAEGTRYLDDLPMRFIALKERAEHLLILRVGVVENAWLPISGSLRFITSSPPEHPLDTSPWPSRIINCRCALST